MKLHVQLCLWGAKFMIFYKLDIHQSDMPIPFGKIAAHELGNVHDFALIYRY